MTWFRIDDGWHAHPKVIGLSFAARGLWLTAGTWCAQYLTDGAVPRKTLDAWGASHELARELVDVGLWGETPDGWQFHDWHDYQPTRADVMAKRSASADRMRVMRSGGVRANNSATPANGAQGVHAKLLTPVPSRPDPVPSQERERAHAIEPAPSPRSEIGRAFEALESGAAYRATAEFRACPALQNVASHDFQAWRQDWAWIGAQAEEERAAVIATLARSAWATKQWRRCNPGHIRKHWQTYAGGEEPGFQPANDNGRPMVGMSDVGRPDEFEENPRL